MANGRYPILAREGWGHTAIAIGVATVVHFFAGWLWAAPLWFIAIFVVQFFRDPPRQIPLVTGGVLAPADGKVIALGEANDPYLNRKAKRISIFMNVVNVHSNRIPVEGKIMQRWYSKGAFLNAALDKASEHNERNALWVRTEAGHDIVVVQVAGLIARRILCYVDPGDRVTPGQRYGFIRFGSRVDVYLPLDSQFKVALGDTTSAASDVVAMLGEGKKNGTAK
jgi:phosphatidylserine decarboxylase